jgi:hypothetical protein
VLKTAVGASAFQAAASSICRVCYNSGASKFTSEMSYFGDIVFRTQRVLTDFCFLTCAQRFATRD